MEGGIKELAEDHVLNRGNPHPNLTAKSMLNSHADQRVTWSAVDDALEDVVLLYSYRHHQPLVRGPAWRRRIES